MEDMECTDPLCMIPGMVPNPLNMPKGCAFAERCGRRMDRCNAEVPPLYEVEGRTLRCFLFDPAAGGGSAPVRSEGGTA
jgi:oligopeptide/dipeptide ABC transporter ATP-binding protein